MSLPPHDVPDGKELFTRDEMEHYAARQWAREQIIQLQNGQIDQSKKLVEVVGQFTAELRSVGEGLRNIPTLIQAQVSVCKEDLRKENSKEFFTQTGAMQLETHLKLKMAEDNKALSSQISEMKVANDLQWGKVKWTIWLVGFMAGSAQWYFSTGKAIVSVAGG